MANTGYICVAVDYGSDVEEIIAQIGKRVDDRFNPETMSDDFEGYYNKAGWKNFCATPIHPSGRPEMLIYPRTKKVMTPCVILIEIDRLHRGDVEYLLKDIKGTSRYIFLDCRNAEMWEGAGEAV